MANSSRSKTNVKGSFPKPEKPSPDFPLTPHAMGRWQKKIGGKVYYFGRWGKRQNGETVFLPDLGIQQALDEYHAFVANGNRYPDETSEQVVTVGMIANQFRASKEAQNKAGELSDRMLTEYINTCDLLVARLGAKTNAAELRPADFSKLASYFLERWGPHRRGNEVQKAKTMFRWSFEAELLPREPRYGPDFKKPSKDVLRRHKAERKRERGAKLLTAEELRAVIEVASLPHAAMIYLAINSALGVRDLCELPLSALDLDKGFLDYDRPKSGIERRSALWPETVASLKEWIAERPTPATDKQRRLVFLKPDGQQFTANALSQQVRKLFKTAGVHRTEVGISWCRPTFRTVADGAGDNPAARLAMGHADSSIDDIYRQSISDERLVNIANHVRRWLNGGVE